MNLRSRSGVALTVAIMMMICSSILAGYALQAGWNQRRMTIVNGSKRDRIYWAAKAGVVDARWRIREGMRNSNSSGLFPGGNFNDDLYNPNSYDIDLDNNGVVDVSVDIGAVNGGVREIVATGKDF